MELQHPFIRLPFAFDAQRLAQEIAVFEGPDWMPHPSGIKGNLAIPLISLNGEKNNHFAGQMATTPFLERCPYIQQIMGSFDEVLARSRLMRLDAACEVKAHVDFNYHWHSRVRIHIPIITTPDVTFYCGDQELHMQAGECWIFDSWRWHNVINRGTKNRVHLVIDLAGASKFWNMVEQMSQLDGPKHAKTLNDLIKAIPYIPDATPNIVTERYNVSPVMSPGELDALAKELINDFSANGNNDQTLVARYRTVLADLTKDWRAVWAQYGYTEQGWTHYRQLLDGVIQQLHPNPRALTTSSNDVGVNPIIMQRIVRAALHTDQLDRF